MKNIKRTRFLGLTLLAAGMAVPAVAQLSKPRIIEFDAPGAGTGAGQGTYAVGANFGSLVTGYYLDAAGVNHGFIRESDGKVIVVDAPGAGASASQGTIAWAVLPDLTVTGYYIDANGVWHGFLRSPDGQFKTIDIPQAGAGAGQ